MLLCVLEVEERRKEGRKEGKKEGCGRGRVRLDAIP